MNLNPTNHEPLVGAMRRAPLPRYWPGQDFGVRAPLPGETPLSSDEWRVAFRNGLLRPPPAVNRGDAC